MNLPVRETQCQECIQDNKDDCCENDWVASKLSGLMIGLAADIRRKENI